MFALRRFAVGQNARPHSSSKGGGMIFRPRYCANCGEKIERKEWHVWTSRRFCQVCESEFKGQDLIPRIVLLIAVLIGGVNGWDYLKRGAGADSGPTKQAKAVERPVASVAANSGAGSPANDDAAESQMARAANTPQPPPRSLADMQPSRTVTRRNDEAEGAMYYCGAQTKKGTPCSRRVKGNIRCFQHTGMPAMLPPDKLRVG